MKFTVVYKAESFIPIQVEAETPEEAEGKAHLLYSEMPLERRRLEFMERLAISKIEIYTKEVK